MSPRLSYCLRREGFYPSSYPSPNQRSAMAWCRADVSAPVDRRTPIRSGENPTGKARPPSITAVGGMARERELGFAGGHMGVWAEDRLRYLGALEELRSTSPSRYGQCLRRRWFDYTLKEGPRPGTDGPSSKDRLLCRSPLHVFRCRAGLTRRQIFLGPGAGIHVKQWGLGFILGYDSRTIFSLQAGASISRSGRPFTIALWRRFNYQKIEGFAIGYLNPLPKVVLVSGSMAFQFRAGSLLCSSVY